MQWTIVVCFVMYRVIIDVKLWTFWIDYYHNFADLVPREVLDQWLKHLRRSFPTVAFKASTQAQSNRLGRQKMKRRAPKEALQVSQCVGAELLMSLLANYCRNKGIKTSITVGIIGKFYGF